MKSSDKFLMETTRYELDAINAFLKPAGISEAPTAKITAEDLDRAAAEGQQLTEINDALAKNASTEVAAAARLIHESNRARRDINIAEASHKRLLLGMYRTMYQRKLKLERKIQEDVNG